MFAIKIQVRASINNLYVEDDMITQGIKPNDSQSLVICLQRSLGNFLSVNTLNNIARHIVKEMQTCTNTANYKQIIENNIKGCLFRIYIKRVG